MGLRALEAAGVHGVRVDPDAALVAAARAEPDAFVALYDRYFDRVLGYVRLRIRDAPTCEDVVSTVFTTALAQLPRFRGEGTFAGWLFRIARNATLDVQRRHAVPVPMFGEAASPEPGPEERLLALGSAALATAAVAAAVVALVGPGGSGGPSPANAAILAHVLRASSPPAGIVVHVSEVGRLPDGAEVAAEWWQDTSAPYAFRLVKGPVGAETEVASDGTTHTQYDPGTDTVYRQPDATPPHLIDPIQTLRAGLVAGTARIAGTTTIDGRALYEVDLPGGAAGYFDTGDYAPAYIDNPQRNGTVVRTRVVAYDELPRTTASEQLLSVAAQHPGARVTDGAPPAPTKTPGASK